jgi:hypothetical protein
MAPYSVILVSVMHRSSITQDPAQNQAQSNHRAGGFTFLTSSDGRSTMRLSTHVFAWQTKPSAFLHHERHEDHERVAARSFLLIFVAFVSFVVNAP